MKQFIEKSSWKLISENFLNFSYVELSIFSIRIAFIYKYNSNVFKNKRDLAWFLKMKEK